MEKLKLGLCLPTIAKNMSLLQVKNYVLFVCERQLSVSLSLLCESLCSVYDNFLDRHVLSAFHRKSNNIASDYPCILFSLYSQVSCTSNSLE